MSINKEPRKYSASEVSSEAVGTYEWMPRGRLKLCLAVAVMALACVSTAMAQGGQQVTPMGGSTVQHPMSTAPLTVDPREDQSAIYQQMKQQRNALRQRKLLEKTQQLQQLSDELRAEVAKTDKDTLSVDVIRKSEQIEKLAKSIHELIVTPL